jgi:ubiquinone/menaquinone biosynthesis C-methylase UbiE
MAVPEPRRDPENAELITLQPYLPQPKDRVLDIGCGDGRLTWILARTAGLAAGFAGLAAGFAGLAAGVDIDLDELHRAPGTRPEAVSARVCFAAAATEAIPFASQSFNLAIFTWSL